MKHKQQEELEYEIVYCKKTAFLRISLILVLLIGIYQIVGIMTKEEFSYDYLYDEDYSDKELKRFFDLHSESREVVILGDVFINEAKPIKLILRDFQLLNKDENVELILSSKLAPKDVISIGILNTSETDLEFELPVENLNYHNFILFWDLETKEVYASIALKE